MSRKLTKENGKGLLEFIDLFALVGSSDVHTKIVCVACMFASACVKRE
ncbi:hypothetical protein [Bartonella raoultii]|nr:hypothetical protein [Bartonella raoultii]